MRITLGPAAHGSTYHFRVATDYGGAYGGQPRPGNRSPHPGEQGPGGPPGWPPSPGPRPARRRGPAAVAVLVVGVIGLLAALAGVADQALPRRFSAAQRTRITDWEYGQRWRTLPAGTIFPASVSYGPPSVLGDDPSLMLSARRVGVARPASCTAAADPTAARMLDRDGCAAMLRATYVDGTGSYVVTVGAAVLPGSARAAAAAQAVTGAASSSGLGSTVRTVPFRNTPAAAFTDKRRQLSGAIAIGSYVVLYAVGYADDRPAEPVARDSYTDSEMTSAGTGVARAVLAELAAPVPPPHCPGTPGC